ncbi:MAG: hypothetical protein WCO56_15740 [Verrucomicrobiota bacterium]
MEQNYRISGHESFPCRYAWLPKAVQGVSYDNLVLLRNVVCRCNVNISKVYHFEWHNYSILVIEAIRLNNFTLSGDSIDVALFRTQQERDNALAA